MLGLVVEVPGRRRIFLPMTRVTVDRHRPGHHHRPGQHAPLRAAARPRRSSSASCSTARSRCSRTAPRRCVEDVAHGAAAHPRLGAHQGVRPPPGQGPAPPRRDAHRRLGRGHRRSALDEARARAPPTCSRPSSSCDAADLASVLHELSPKRRVEVAAALDDEKLADVLEELPEDDQVEILGKLEEERAADVLEAMQPDDAADLLSELPAGRGREAARADGAGRGRAGAPPARATPRTPPAA